MFFNVKKKKQNTVYPHKVSVVAETKSFILYKKYKGSKITTLEGT